MSNNTYTRAGAAAACALTLTLSAHPQVSALGWVEVPNNTWAPTGQSPLTDPVGGTIWASRTWRTFDLEIRGAAGTIVNAINLGGLPGEPYQISTGGGEVFNHPAGSDVRSFQLEPLFAAVGFDTYACFGGDDFQDGQPFGVFLGSIQNLSGQGGVIRYTATARPGIPATIEPDGTLRVLRITVASDFDPLTGGAGRAQVGLPGGLLLDFDVGRWADIPAPGAASLLAISALIGARRRRTDRTLACPPSHTRHAEGGMSSDVRHMH